MPWKTPLSAFLRRTFTLALAFITFLATGSWTGFGTAVAENEICDHGGSVVAQGSYVVMNNKWGNRNATLCIAPMGSGFNITQMVGFNDPDHWKKPPVGYPSIFLGCHYRSCSPDRSLPAPLSRITSAPSSVSFAFVANGIYDAAYDIWLYTGADTPPGGPAVEIMIHFTDQGLPPLPVEPVSVGGRDWGLWQTRAWWRGGGGGCGCDCASDAAVASLHHSSHLDRGLV